LVQPVVDALHKMGVTGAETTGRNDIVVDGKKFSGNAMYTRGGKTFSHGTLMFDVDTDAVADALRVPKDKIESKGIKSVRSRVTNIKPYLQRDMDILEFKEILLNHIFLMDGKEAEEYILNEEQQAEIEKLFKEKYSTWEWNYGSSPSFNYKNSKRFAFGLIEIRLQIDQGYINQCKIFGDFFGSARIEDLEKALIGLRYDEEMVADFVEKVNLQSYFGNIKNEEFIDLLFR
ncbi:MAG TPA: lipoate--protein ligase, partial [Tissierellaceae bacterium]|nr:lipoate--protein ligase [Tissierellaceae bacterium]